MSKRKGERMKEARTQMVKIRMTIKEKETLTQQAKAKGLNVSDYIRKVSARPPNVTRGEFETAVQKSIYEIHKIGVNINQIAKKYNENDYVQPRNELIQKLNRIYELLYELTEFIKNRG